MLLRDPRDIVLSYRRWLLTGLSAPDHPTHANLLQLFGDDLPEDEWLRLAARNGLLAELTRFRDIWAAHADEKLTIHFDDLVVDPKAAVNEVEDYFSLPRSDRVRLHKRRYTRSHLRNRLFKLGQTTLASRFKEVTGVRWIISLIIGTGRPV